MRRCSLNAAVAEVILPGDRRAQARAGGGATPPVAAQGPVRAPAAPHKAAPHDTHSGPESIIPRADM